jgi:dihydroneopterin aldolase
MRDRLLIRDLAVSCRLGIHEWEQRTPQEVLVDLELPVDARRGARRDDVAEAVDYARLVATVRATAQARPFRLMETLAEVLAHDVLSAFGVGAVVVRVKKRAVEGLGYAAVEIERFLGARRRARMARSAPRRAARGPAGTRVSVGR